MKKHLSDGVVNDASDSLIERLLPRPHNAYPGHRPKDQIDICRSPSLKFSSNEPPNTNNVFKSMKPLLSSKTTILTLLIGLILMLPSAISNNVDETNHQKSTIKLEHSCETVSLFLLDKDQNFIPFEVESCPNELRLAILSSNGDEFVIDLVKNSFLISDRYFEMNEKSTDKLGQKINSGSANQNSDFYRNHHYISLHDFKDNKEHCHYQGFVNDDHLSMAAISIVDSHSLSGIFYNGNDSYHLLADTDARSTLLVKVHSGSSTSKISSLGFPNNQEELEKCLNDTIKRKLPHQVGEQYHLIDNNRFRRDTSSVTPSSKTKLKRKRKSSQDNKVLHGPYQRNANSLFVELLIVHDYNQFREYNSTKTLIAERTMQIVNIMNAFYRQLNIFVALVGVILWTVEDEIKLTEDGDSTLTNFLKYRYEKLLPHYHHDNAQLITSTSFNGSVVGKALKGPICTHDHSGGVNTDHSHSPAIVAVTLAHELGHNLGMEHDEDDKCSCPDEKCIMSSSSSIVHPKHWSSCSVDYLEDSRKHGLLDCLINEPEQVFGPICGNGFVEEGEDCDVGEPIPSDGTSRSRNKNIRSSLSGTTSNWINNPCCDRYTCKFVANATCAQGPCCDLTRCSVFNSTETKICRPRKNECDFEETCDGVSEFCPMDVHYHDGIECGPTATDSLASSYDQSISSLSPYPIGSTAYNRTRSYCYQGQCASHESQCQLLWGSSGTTSRDICYDQNVHGNTSGNCGYNRKEKIYEVCESEDALCGMLHCVHNQLNSIDSTRKTGKLLYGFESASILTVSFFVMSNHERIYCHGAIVDAGPYMQDPGMVPNGASCGQDKMCLNQKCVTVTDVLYKNWCPSDCNGNGICDNTGVCHCHDGTVGTSCYQFFGSNFHLSLILYIIMFFGPMIALALLAANHYKKKIEVWWYLHNRKIALRTKPGHHHQPAHAQNRRAMAYQVKSHQVSISEPIPLSNQQFNKQNSTSNHLPPNYNPVTQQASTDPWAETSTSTSAAPSSTLVSSLITPTHTTDATAAAFGLSKSPGYRLEPLSKKPLEPLPPPVPPHQNRQKPPTSKLNDSKSNSGSDKLRIVRVAPPPPPAHANQRS